MGKEVDTTSEPGCDGCPAVNHKERNDPPIPRLAYSPEEAAQALGVHRFTVYRLVQRGKLHACRQLRHWLIPVKEVERFLMEGAE